MGHRTNGAVPQRTRLRLLAACLGVACAAAGDLGCGSAVSAAAGPATLTVYAHQPAIRTSLHLQPGFATIVRADRRIDTVAVGDPRLVTATPVHRGADVFDVVLQPQTDTGTTNMVIWLGDVTTVWNLEIGPGLRTADVVFVVTQGHNAAPPIVLPTSGVHGTASAGPANATRTVAAAPSSRPAPTSPAPPAVAPPVPTIQLGQSAGPVRAVFTASRTPNGILFRYEITNGGDADLAIRPTTILVRADGRPVAYGMARDSVDRGRPDIIPRGATETGVIDVALPAARQIELALSLLPVHAASPGSEPSASSQTPPAARAGMAPSAPLPIVLQWTFSGLDRLPVAPAP